MIAGRTIAGMTNQPDGVQYSDDGHYWWDGSEWQPVAAAADEPVDLTDFPVISALIEAGEVDGWLRWMGLNPEELATAGGSANLS